MQSSQVFDKSAAARVGRDNQVYAEETGARLVAGCVCLNEDRSKILMVQSSAHKKKWVLPKGGVEKDEYPYYNKTAIRETWEEAGCIGDIVKDLGIVQDMRPPKKWGNLEKFNNHDNNSNNHNDIKKVGLAVEEKQAKDVPIPPRSEFHFFQMIVKETPNIYPESHKRKRKWFDYSQCIEELTRAKRPELIECVERSDILKN